MRNTSGVCGGARSLWGTEGTEGDRGAGAARGPWWMGGQAEPAALTVSLSCDHRQGKDRSHSQDRRTGWSLDWRRKGPGRHQTSRAWPAQPLHPRTSIPNSRRQPSPSSSTGGHKPRGSEAPAQSWPRVQSLGLACFGL